MNSLTAVFTGALLLSTSLSWGQMNADQAWQALPGYVFGQSREPLATIEEQIRKGGAGERAAIEQRLLEVLKAANTTTDSRRFICRALGVVGSEKAVAPLAALLADKDLSHPARIALEALPFDSAAKALTEALPKVEGNLQLGVISSIGTRRVASAVPRLSKLAEGKDPTIAAAALAALGEIGTEDASRALAAAKVSPELSRALNRARVAAGWRLAEAGKRGPAATVFRSLNEASNQPKETRVAAVQGLVATLPAREAAAFMEKSLQDPDEVIRLAAVKAFAKAGETQNGIVERLPQMQPSAQVLVLNMVSDLPKVAARKPALQVLNDSKEPAVRAAALECLAVHGEPKDVETIARLAATAEEPVKSAARRTLTRMSGRGVDASMITLIESTDPAVRKAVMETLPARRMDTALPVLAKLMRGSDAPLALDAVRTIGVMGRLQELGEVAQVLVATGSPQLRDAAEEAVKAICSRAQDKKACADVIQRELEKAGTPEAKAALLPATLYTGGESGLQQVLKAMSSDNSELRNVAFRTLVSWPEARAAGPLLQNAETNSNPTQAIVALRDGCLRLAEMEEVPVSERAAILKRVTEIAKRSEEKRRAVTLMAQVPSRELLELLPTLAAQNDLRAEVLNSTIQLARNLGAVYPAQSTAVLEKMLGVSETPEQKKSIENAIKAVRNAGQSPDGFILAWWLAGPFSEGDKDQAALFDVAFGPEKSDTGVDWRPVVAPQNGMIDLLKLMPGGNRVAYLRALVNSEQEQKARLELGSDDGVKVWLNGQMIHAHNTVRPCAPGQDKVDVNLKNGENVLLLKITQGGGDWAAVARLIGTDSKPLSSIMIGAAK